MELVEICPPGRQRRLLISCLARCTPPRHQLRELLGKLLADCPVGEEPGSGEAGLRGQELERGRKTLQCLSSALY